MELWDILNERGEKTGGTVERGEPLKSGQFHQVVHIWIVNSQGQLLIQKRALSVEKMPGIWAVTGGSAVSGEDGLTAAQRELDEELGLTVEKSAFRHFSHLRRRNSFTELYLLKSEASLDSLAFQAEEVAEAAWVSWNQLMTMVKKREFHNYGRWYFHILRRQLYDSHKKQDGGVKGQP